MRRRPPARRAAPLVRRLGALFGPLAVLACNGVEVGPEGNPPPVLEAIRPDVVRPDPAGAVVDVLGAGFVEDAEVLWNGEPRTASYVSETRVSVQLPESDLATGSGEISVRNPAPGGGTSPSLTLVVANPAPSLASLAPAEADAVVDANLTLVVGGSGFVTGASILWDGIALETEVVSDTELHTTLPDYLLQGGRTVTVTASNPPPGGGGSNGLAFELRNPVPAVTAMEPGGATMGRDTPVEIEGTGFVYGALVRIESTILTPDAISGSHLSVVIPAELAAPLGAVHDLTVENPGPGGGASAPLRFEVWGIPPTIDQISPSRVLAGVSDFTLLLSGADIDATASVTWNGAAHTYSIVDPTRIEIPVSAAEVSIPDTIVIAVQNPGSEVVATAELVVLDAPSTGSLLAGIRTGGGSILVTDTEGAGVAATPITGGGYRVDASPDGSTVVYYGGRIYEQDVFTGERRDATSPPTSSNEQWARYSADGQWIYFMSYTSGWEVWRTPAAGGSSELLVGGGDRGYPAPSHGGDRLVYTIGVSPTNPDTRLWILDLVTRTSTPLNVRGQTARWTPDDQWIVYWVPGAHALRAIHPDGTGDFALSTGLEIGPAFDISPDGRWLVAALENQSAAVRIDFPSGDVTPLPGLGAVESMAVFGP